MLIQSKLNRDVIKYINQLNDPPRRPDSGLTKRERSKLKRAAKLKTAGYKDTPVVTTKAVKHTRKARVDSDKVVAHAKRAVHLHRKTLERLFRSSQWTAREPSIVEAISKILQTISGLKATYEVQGKVRRIRDRSIKQSTRRDGAVMDLNPRHHKTNKIYISPQQRAINKAKDGVTQAAPKTFKATRLQVVGGTEHVVDTAKKLYGYKPNPTPSSRKQRHALAKELKGFFKKEKYSPYSRVKENLSKAA